MNNTVTFKKKLKDERDVYQVFVYSSTRCGLLVPYVWKFTRYLFSRLLGVVDLYLMRTNNTVISAWLTLHWYNNTVFLICSFHVTVQYPCLRLLHGKPIVLYYSTNCEPSVQLWHYVFPFTLPLSC